MGPVNVIFDKKSFTWFLVHDKRNLSRIHKRTNTYWKCSRQIAYTDIWILINFQKYSSYSFPYIVRRGSKVTTTLKEEEEEEERRSPQFEFKCIHSILLSDEMLHVDLNKWKMIFSTHTNKIILLQFHFETCKNICPYLFFLQ